MECGMAQVVTIPAIGLGTAGLFGATDDVVLAALDLGVKLIDTAQATEWYDEKSVARIVQSRENSDVFIVTKVHPRSYGILEMKRALDISHRNFGGKGKIDAVLLHAPFCWQGHCTKEQEAISWLDGWRHLETLQDSFGITYIGVSNLDLDQLKDLVLNRTNRKVAILQNWMDPLHQDTEVRRFCADHGIVYMAYSSFGTQWSQSQRALGRNPVLTNSVLLDIARRYRSTVTQVVLSWLATEGVVAIPRASSADHLLENFHICSTNNGSMLCEREGSLHLPVEGGLGVELTLDDIQRIRALDNSIGLPWD